MIKTIPDNLAPLFSVISPSFFSIYNYSYSLIPLTSRQDKANELLREFDALGTPKSSVALKPSFADFVKSLESYVPAIEIQKDFVAIPHYHLQNKRTPKRFRCRVDGNGKLVARRSSYAYQDRSKSSS